MRREENHRPLEMYAVMRLESDQGTHKLMVALPLKPAGWITIWLDWYGPASDVQSLNDGYGDYGHVSAPAGADGGRVPVWADAESVLIVGDKLICTPGGEKTGKYNNVRQIVNKAAMSSSMGTSSRITALAGSAWSCRPARNAGSRGGRPRARWSMPMACSTAWEKKEAMTGFLEANPAAFKRVSRFQLPTGEGRCWTPPVISDGTLHLRWSDNHYVYDIKK